MGILFPLKKKNKIQLLVKEAKQVLHLYPLMVVLYPKNKEIKR